jgi:hypothetical protein
MGYKLLRKRGPVSRKAQVEVITVMLILAITVAAVFVAYQFAAPQIERSRDVSRINSMQNALLELDKKIREVRFEGEGAQRYIDINFDKGNIRVNQNEDTIWFYMSAPGIESAPQQTGMETYFSDRTINIKLQYGGEIDILSRFEVLNAGQYRIYIKNEGANDILLSLSPEIPITGDTWTLQGYVYDNTEGQTEGDAIMNTTGDTIDPPLANAEIVFINDKLETIAITRTNSQGRYAVKLPKSDGVNDLKLYIRVNLTSYVMKENEGSVAIYTKTDQYQKGFKKNLGPWIVNISAGKNDFEDYYDANDFLNIPMYKLTKQDIFESVPIAVVLYAGGPTTGGYSINSGNELGHLLYDVMDAFDSSSTSNYNCNYFVVYGSVGPDPVGLKDKNNNPINYPNTTINVEMYPIEWLLDTTERRSPSDYSSLNPIFPEIAAIDGNPNILNYRDFSLIVVGSGATNDSNLLPKLNVYRGDLTNFLTLNMLSFKGVDYSRGLITLGQFSIVDDIDPDSDNYLPYPSLLNDLDPPKIKNLNIVPDGQNPAAVQHPYVWINQNGGNVYFYCNVKDVSGINHVGVNVYKQDGTLIGGTFLFDDGRAPDRLAGDSTYSAEWTVPDGLLDGSYNVIFESTDEYGNFVERITFYPTDPLSNFKFDVRNDLVLPDTSTLISSSLGYITTSPYTKISSSVSDVLSGIDRSTYGTQTLQFLSNPLPTQLHNYYHYLSLSEGNLNYSVLTYDKAQNQGTPQVTTILKDTAPPLISNKYPTELAANNTPIIIAEYGDAGAGIKIARLYLDGDYKISSITNSVTYTPGAALNDGTHISTVYVEDNLGNFAVDYWNFYVNNLGPAITISQPQNFLTFTNSPTISISGSTSTTGSVTLERNSTFIDTTTSQSFNSPTVNLLSGLNIIRIEADGDPFFNDQNNTIATRWIIRDNDFPSITINDPTALSPQIVRPLTKAYITFTYDEEYPASYIIKIYDGATLIAQTPIRIINGPNLNYIKAGGIHTIMDTIDVPTNVSDGGLYDINITMQDLAGNSVTVTGNDILKIKSTGPLLQGELPLQGNFASTTDSIEISIVDALVGVDKNSIKMFIIGQSYDNVSVINLNVTDNLNITQVGAQGYRAVFTPTWPWENTYKINVSVEASDKLGNKSTKSWYYITTSQSPVIKDLSMEHRVQEGTEVSMSFNVEQCITKIKEVDISIGKLGKVSYVETAPGSLTLQRSADSLSGAPATITGVNAGTCTGGTLYKYSFNNITFSVPDYAGDLNNRVLITSINEADWESYYESYLLTSKQEYISAPNTYYFGKYSWLPTFQGLDLSIGRVSNEPIGSNYKIYGQVNDAHRNIPVIYTAWRKSRGPPGNPNIVNSEQWSGALYVDKDGNKIEWDHGFIPNSFLFDIDAPIGSTWPPGRPFQAQDWLDSFNLDLVLTDRQNNLQKTSLDNPIVSILPNEFAMCAHDYFDITSTGWANNNVIINLRTFQKIYEVRGDTEDIPPSGPFTRTGGTILVPQAPGGPVLLIKERRNIFNNLESTIIATTLDLDRYKNNRNVTYGKNMHLDEAYSSDARKLEQNIIVYACGHEILID